MVLMAIDAVHEGALPTTTWQGVLRSHGAQLSRCKLLELGAS